VTEDLYETNLSSQSYYSEGKKKRRKKPTRKLLAHFPVADHCSDIVVKTGSGRFFSLKTSGCLSKLSRLWTLATF